MRILFVAPYVPSLVRIRPFNFIKYLARRHEVTVLALQQHEREDEHVSILRPYCARIETVHLSKKRSLLNCLRALPTVTPLQGAYCHSAALRQRLTQLLAESPYDLVHVEHLRAAYIAQSLPGVPCVYDSVDCISLLLERMLQSSKSHLGRLAARLELPRTRRYEAALLGSFDRVLASSRDDKVALEQLGAGDVANRISILPNGVHLAYPLDEVDRQDDDASAIVFSGKMSYHANVDAVRYFCCEILPIVKTLRPEVTLTIVGSDPPREVRALADDGYVRVTGYVADVRPYLRRAAVAVAPIRYAVGIQNKVLEAMAMGTAVVASSAACRALAARPGEDFLAADKAPDFATQIIRLLDDAPLRRRIGGNGRRYVEENHEWSRIADRLSAIYAEVVAARCGPSGIAELKGRTVRVA